MLSDGEVDARLPIDPAHKLEWSIVANGIEEDELEQLRELHALLRDLEARPHPALKKAPFHRQAQTLLRFLRARDGNVDQAESMFRNYLDWRHKFQIDEKVAAWRKELQRCRSRRAKLCLRYAVDVEMCIDKFDIPVRLIRLSVADTAGYWREFGEEALLVESLSKLERTHEEIRKAMFENRKLIRGQIQIIDVGDYGEHGVPNWTNRMWGALANGKDMYKIFDLNFPETVRKVFIIRTGMLTNTIWRIVLPIVPPRTKKKLRLFGYSAIEWVDELRDELAEGQVLQDFLTSDTAVAFSSAKPQGGIVPEGACGHNFGQWEEDANGSRTATSPSSHGKEASGSKRGKAGASKPGSRVPCPWFLAIVIAAAAMGAAWPAAAAWSPST